LDRNRAALWLLAIILCLVILAAGAALGLIVAIVI
jgi:hypothetical protein